MCNIFINGQQIQNLGTVTYTDDFNTLSVVVNFSTDIIFPVGSRAQMFSRTDGSLVLTGIITDVSFGRTDSDGRLGTGAPFIYEYTMMDFGFYLNKNNVIRQYQDTNIATAIIDLCNEINIPLGVLPPTMGTITATFNDRPVDQILIVLLNALEQFERRRFYFECRTGILNVFPYQLNNQMIGRMGNNFMAIRSDNTINSVINTQSMQNLKTAVLVPGDNNNVLDIIRFNQNAVNTFGYMQRVVQSNEPDLNLRRQFATARANDLIAPTNTFSFSMLGDHDIQKGTMMDIVQPNLQMIGRYVITRSTHTISDTHTVNVSLRLNNIP